MRLLYDPIFLEHDTGHHPENRDRLLIFEDGKETISASGADLLSLVHTPNYIDLVRNAYPGLQNLDADTVISEKSFEVANHAVGLTVQASLAGDFALVRPPGHHAYADHGSGFCLFNNIAIATQKLVQQGKRVAIFDFDGHHGDGTAAIFYNTDKVLYWSIHQYPAFPGYGFVDEIGRGVGQGYTINVPLPPGSGDDVLLRSTDLYLSVVKQFAPDVVAISAGFDGHQLDPLLQLNYTTSVFYHIATRLRANFENLFAVLEGGYNPPVLKKCVINFIHGVNSEPYEGEDKATVSGTAITKEFDRRMQLLEKKLTPFWKF